MTKPDVCPCGSGLTYNHCCQRWHLGRAAPTPELLMRSRYTAYVLQMEDYLLATWAVSSRPTALNLEADAGTRWLGLKIMRSENPVDTSLSDTSLSETSLAEGSFAGASLAEVSLAKVSLAEVSATVEFVARYRHGGGAASRLHEISRFVRENGCWYYVDGIILGAVKA